MKRHNIFVQIDENLNTYPAYGIWIESKHFKDDVLYIYYIGISLFIWKNTVFIQNPLDGAEQNI